MRKRFRSEMERARRLIIAGGADHPLRFLLDAAGQWKARHLGGVEELVAVNPGHQTSFHSGLPQRFALEDARFNLHFWSALERQGHTIPRTAIEIGGVPVDLATARAWKEDGHLKDVDLHDHSRWTWGWY